ncbi:Uncharacterized protein Adt_17668 [Abeliophyllum distichum]|uniref:Uncharacterized protein n=1 Tax=Abeliophyllum distichum TaxID=126358 RepID=A0ABD1TH53_9LAMI
MGLRRKISDEYMPNALSEAEKSESRKRKREKHNNVGEEDGNNSVNDPQYELFLGRLKLYEKSYMLEGEKNGIRMVIKYEELGSSEDGCVSNLHKKTSNCTGQKNVLSNEKPCLGDNSPVDKSINNDIQHASGHFAFRKQVINVLRKPYDRQEYDELRRAVKARKIEESNGDLCTGSKRSLGKSYLDDYGDLHRMLKKFEKDRRKNLNILRGFFFWLEHKTMEGAFKPWKDPELSTSAYPSSSLLPGKKKRATPSEPGNDPETVVEEQENSPPPPSCRGRKERKKS